MHHRTTPTTREQFGTLLGRLGRAWRAEIDARLAPVGLTQARWLILYHLSRGANGGPQTALAARVGVQGPTLVRMLDRLEAEGLIERRDAVGDRRVNSVHATARALPVLKRIQSVVNQVRSDMLAGVSEDEIAICVGVFQRIAANIRADQGGAARPGGKPATTDDNGQRSKVGQHARSGG